MKATIRNILVFVLMAMMVISVAVAKGNPHKFPDEPISSPRPIAPVPCYECTITIP